MFYKAANVVSSNKFVRFSLRELLAVSYLIFSISDFIQNFIGMGSQTYAV